MHRLRPGYLRIINWPGSVHLVSRGHSEHRHRSDESFQLFIVQRGLLCERWLQLVFAMRRGYLLCRWWGTPGLAAGACLAAAAGIAVQRRGLASTIRLTGAETRQALVDLGCLGGVLLTGCLAYHFWTPVNWTQLTVFGLGLGSLGGGILLARQREALHLAGVRLPRFGARLVVRPTSPK